MSLLVLLSPAKKQAFSPPNTQYKTSLPQLRKKTAMLVDRLKKLNSSELAKLLKISSSLGELNYQRYQAFDVDKYTHKNASPCLWTFQGDVYRMLDAKHLQTPAILFAQNHLRILSGLYGLLKPLDLMQPYRLEMSCKLKCNDNNNLYEFWSQAITEAINEECATMRSPYIVNLASQEYSKAIERTRLKNIMVEIIFKQTRHGKLQNIGLFSKRARGQMTRFILEHKINIISRIKEFNMDGYQLSPSLSNNEKLVFITKQV